MHMLVILTVLAIEHQTNDILPPIRCNLTHENILQILGGEIKKKIPIPPVLNQMTHCAVGWLSGHHGK